MGWYEIKQWLEMSLGLHMDALHIHAGVLLQLLAALMLRRPLRNPWPWLVVLFATAANEIYDLHHETWPDADRARQWAEGLKDAWNTMLIPTVLLVTARLKPQLFVGRFAPSGQGGEGDVLAR